MREDLIGIAAMSENRAIGKDNKIPWHISADLRRFKRLTEGHIVVMGRLTYESLGASLPKRTNIVMSSREITGIQTIPDLEGLERVLNSMPYRKVFVIGGSQIYKLLMEFCSEFHLTLVKDQPDADRFLPAFEHLFAGYTVEEQSIGYEFRHYLRHAPKNFVRTRSLPEHVQV